ncbi:hypothetical protein SUGI_0704540 [Cryptomeria japonica]|nr:hypothetical protein SUGI_0704540 [Cryptomeria japonica]
MDRLPEDIVREVVLRVPYIFHNELRYVSKMWKTIIKSEQLYKERISSGLSDKLVCFLDQSDDCNKIAIYDPVHNSVARSPSMPLKFQYTDYSHCLCVDQKLIVIGLQYENEATRATMVFDFMSSTWRKGAETPIQEFGHQCACCASPGGGLVYIAQESQVAVYDVAQDKWELLPGIQDPIDLVRGYYIDGMFHVVSVFAKPFYQTYRFNPVTQQWEVLHGFNLLQYPPLSFVAEFGYIYSFDINKVMEFDCSRKIWIEARHVPQHLNWLGGIESENYLFVTGKIEGSPKFELCDETSSELCNETLSELTDETLNELYENNSSIFKWRWVFNNRTWSYYNFLVMVEI